MNAQRRVGPFGPLFLGVAAAILLVSGGLLVWRVGRPATIFTLQDVPEGASRHTVGGIDIWVVKDGTTVETFIDRSPHLGERLAWCDDAEVFISLAHGETFNRHGARIAGPAARGLSRIRAWFGPSGSVVVDIAVVTPGEPPGARSTGPPGTAAPTAITYPLGDPRATTTTTTMPFCVSPRS